MRHFATVVVTAFVGASNCWAENPRPVNSLLEMRHNNVVIQKWDLSCGAAALATIIKYQYGDPVSEKDIAKALMSRREYIENPEFVKIRQGFSLLDLKRYVDSRGYQGMDLASWPSRTSSIRRRSCIPVTFLATTILSCFLALWGQSPPSRSRLGIEPCCGATLKMPGSIMARPWARSFVVERHGTVPPNQLRPKANDFVMLR
jgi:hypothetical protein